jgi:hypothetical protein
MRTAVRNACHLLVAVVVGAVVFVAVAATLYAAASVIAAAW